MWVSTGPQHSWVGARGRWATLWKAKQGEAWVKGRSRLLDGQAAVVEELADDSWVSHSRGVPQVVVILSNLPKHPPHDFPWGPQNSGYPVIALTHSSPAKKASIHTHSTTTRPWPIPNPIP